MTMKKNEMQLSNSKSTYFKKIYSKYVSSMKHSMMTSHNLCERLSKKFIYASNK